MTMWTPNADVESDFSDLPGTDLPNKPRRSRRRAWRDGLAEQTVAKNFEDIRAYRAFERAIIGNVDPRSTIELALVHRLANLFWRVGRYEARLWRQAVQTIWTLEAMSRPQPASARRPSRKPLARFYWDAER